MGRAIGNATASPTNVMPTTTRMIAVIPATRPTVTPTIGEGPRLAVGAKDEVIRGLRLRWGLLLIEGSPASGVRPMGGKPSGHASDVAPGSGATRHERRPSRR